MYQTMNETQQIINMTLIMTPKTDACMGRNYNNYMTKTTYYLDLSTLMDCKKRDRKKKRYDS